jgi:hypothetical protein
MASGRALQRAPRCGPNRLWQDAHALKGATERAASELGEARKLNRDDRFSNIARLKTVGFGVPKIRALYEATYFTGLRKARVPEE